MLTFQELVDARRHLGVPVAGVVQSGTVLRVARLEYLFQHLQAEEEATLTGRPYSVVQLMNNVVNGQTITVTITPQGGVAGTPITYEVTYADQTATDPRLSVALNLSYAVTAAAQGVWAAGGAFLPQNTSAVLPPFSQCTLTSQSMFTIAVTTTGGLVANIFRNGYYPSPQLSYYDSTNTLQMVYGLLPICNYLENAIYGATDNLEVDSAASSGAQGGIRVRHDELQQRELLYRRAVARMSKFFGKWGN